MKKFISTLLLLSIVGITRPSTALASDGNETETEKPWGVRADVVSHYLWRGDQLGGLSFQPNMWYNIGNFTVDLWANVGAKDWHFEGTNKEFDLTLTYRLKQFDFQLIHYYFFNGNYFDLGIENEGANQLEATVKYTLPKLPLQFVVSTTIAGADGILDEEKSTDENEVLKRAYSTYIEANYTWEWENPGMRLQAILAATPWKGMYSGEYKGGICNISARLDKIWTIGHSSINLQATPMYSPTLKKFSWCVGLGIEF